MKLLPELEGLSFAQLTLKQKAQLERLGLNNKAYASLGPATQKLAQQVFTEGIAKKKKFSAKHAP